MQCHRRWYVIEERLGMGSASSHPDRHSARIGILCNASSTCMGAEMYAMAAEGVSIHSSRLSEPAQATAHGGADSELAREVRLLTQAAVDVLLFADDTASYLHGPGTDAAVIAAMERWSGRRLPCSTTAVAGLTALEELGVTTIALVSSLPADVHEAAIEFFGDHGHRVVSGRNLAFPDDAELSPEQVHDLCLAADSPEASAVYIASTSMRSVAVIESLEQRLEKPVVSAAQASFWHCLELIGTAGAVTGFGRLFGGSHLRVLA
jgi:maleate isomerase